MILGITGGSGAGKTTLLELIREKGGLVLDCDAIYHRLLKTDRELVEAIEARFPGTVTDGVLDRKKLAAVAFAHGQALADLNRITHSAVKREVLRQLEEKSSLAAIDAIALFEGDLASLCDVTVAVVAPVEDRVARIVSRDQIDEARARARIAAQKPDDWFAENCDYILENTGTAQEFQKKCLAFFDRVGIIKENSKGE